MHDDNLYFTFDRNAFFIFIYVMPVYSLLRKGAMSKCVRSGTCGEKASIDDTPSRNAFDTIFLSFVERDKC